MKLPYGKIDTYQVARRAEEIVLDLILEYGIFIDVHLERSCFSIINPIGQPEPEMVNYISGITYWIDEHAFETIGELKKALKNRAFM